MSRLSRSRILTVVAVMLAAWALSAVAALSIGSVSISPATSVQLLASSVAGQPWQDTPAGAILFSVRLPRVLLASLVGAALALAGAVFQSLLRNPLADPYVLGVSSGASMGTILWILCTASAAGQAAGSLVLYARPAAAFAGAAATVAAVYVISGGTDPSGESSQRLLLAGIVMASLLSSINVFLLTGANQADLRGIFYWLIGDLSRPADASIYAVAVMVLAAGILLYMLSNSLNLISSGEEDALTLGVEVPKVKLRAYVLASLVTGAVVSISGPIAYVGLICPHLVRMALGSDNRLLFPAAFLFGAVFTLLADTVARTAVSPAELPVGVITALCGAPLFIYLLRRKGGCW
ncbi:MAG: iron ABC transporter permease [Acidobacteria bacterium]|nr:iron ABC transporter permease [Acidobacteriota bacterium]